MATPTNPGPEPARRATFEALIRARRFTEAEALAVELRRHAPDDAWLATMQAFVLHSLGHHERAVTAAAEALRMGATNPTADFVLGASSGALGRHAEAVPALAAALGKLPDRVDIACLLLEHTAAAEGLDAARPVFQRMSARTADRRLATCWARLLFRAGLEAGLPPGHVSAPVMSVPDWAARAGLALDWTGEPEPLPWEDPIIAGAPEVQRSRSVAMSYTPYVCTLRGATVFSKSNMVLMPDGAVLHDTTADPEFGRYVTNFMSDRVVAERREDRLLLDVGGYVLADLDAAMHLSGSASEHFGHWISEYLPRLNLLRHHPRFAELPLIVDATMPPQHMEYLRLVVPNRVIQLPPAAAFRCRELVVAAPTTFFPVHLTGDHGVPPQRQQPISCNAFRFISQQVLANLPPASRSDRKIYLSRIKRGRRPLNEQLIVDHLAARGFEILIPEDLSFAEQVKAFQEAKIVVAANGSSLMNAIFSPPGTEFFVLSQRGIFNWGLFCGWMKALGYRVTFVCCERETGRKHDNYEVSLEELDAGLAFGTRPW